MNRTLLSGILLFVAVSAMALTGSPPRVATASETWGCGGCQAVACWGGRCFAGRRCFGAFGCRGRVRCCASSRCYSNRHGCWSATCAAPVCSGCCSTTSCSGCYGCGGAITCGCEGAVWYDRPASSEPATYYEPDPAASTNNSTHVAPTGTDHIVFRGSKPAADVATFDVTAPADAQVFINGHATSSGGTQRRYFSRGLHPGLDYEYELLAEITRNGKMVRVRQTIVVQAGQESQLAFSFDGAAPGDERFADSRR